MEKMEFPKIKMEKMNLGKNKTDFRALRLSAHVRVRCALLQLS